MIGYTILQLQTIFFSVVLQGVADFESRFIFVDISAYSKRSDGRSFSASSFISLLGKL
jgi:hypothetical protein